jgi:hypothetical protein
MQKLTWLLVIILQFNCHQNTGRPTVADNRDSMILEYFKLIDSGIKAFDTLNFDHKILRAYLANDTAFFTRMPTFLNYVREYAWENSSRLDSCISVVPISNLDAEEAYRFSFDRNFFCYDHPVVTIARYYDSITLHYLEFTNGEGYEKIYNDTDTIQPYCVLKQNFRKRLSKDQWNEFRWRLNEADYWGLKSKIPDWGILHPSYWKIEGYRKDSEYGWPENHFVERNPPRSPAFREIGYYLMKLAGRKACVIEE